MKKFDWRLAGVGLLSLILAAGVLAQPGAGEPGKAPADAPAPSDGQGSRPADGDWKGGRASPFAASLVGLKVLRNIEYARPDDKPVRLDLYLPEHAKGPTPLVIWIHGGGWRQGSKAFCPAVPLCKDGFAVCSIQYRLTDRAPFPAQIHDCKAAVRFLRANAKKYNLDPERFGAWGASAGGHLAAMLGTSEGLKECEGELGCGEQSSKVQCVCNWFGPTDFGSLPATADLSPMLMQFFGGRPSEKRELSLLASPLAHVTKDDAPFLIVHGDKDLLVPEQQSRVLHEALKKAGVESELVIVKGGGHGFAGDQAWEEFERVRAFFVKWLKPAPLGAASAAERKAEPAAAP